MVLGSCVALYHFHFLSMLSVKIDYLFGLMRVIQVWLSLDLVRRSLGLGPFNRMKTQTIGLMKWKNGIGTNNHSCTRCTPPECAFSRKAVEERVFESLGHTNCARQQVPVDAVCLLNRDCAFSCPIHQKLYIYFPYARI